MRRHVFSITMVGCVLVVVTIAPWLPVATHAAPQPWHATNAGTRPVVKTECGNVAGRVDGDGVASFLVRSLFERGCRLWFDADNGSVPRPQGIKFGAAPVGDRRWKPPVSLKHANECVAGRWARLRVALTALVCVQVLERHVRC